MAKEARDAIISVRISQDEQSRLRKKAEALGVSVSEYLRTTALSQVCSRDELPVNATTSTTPAHDLFLDAPESIQGGGSTGMLWNAPENSSVSGSTLTF